VRTGWRELAQGKILKIWRLGEIKPTNPSHVFGVLCTRFNAQGLRVIIIVVQVGAMKIYVTTVEALKKMKVYHKN
jgi:hypothetical protein